jgi:hypothetical protein
LRRTPIPVEKINSIGRDASSRPMEFFLRWAQQNFCWARCFIASFTKKILNHAMPRRMVHKKFFIPCDALSHGTIRHKHPLFWKSLEMFHFSAKSHRISIVTYET